MRWIKKIGRLSPFVFGSVLFSNFVSAQGYDSIFGPFWDLIDYLFNYLPNNSATQGAYFKFLLWILFFSLYTVLVRKLDIFKRAEQKKQGNIVAMILSLMTVLLMPNRILVALFTSYAYLGAFVLTFLVPIILIWLAHETKNCRLKAGSLLLGGIFLMAFTPIFWTEFTQSWARTISSFMSIAGVGLFIYGIIAFLNCGKGPGPDGETEPPPEETKPPPEGDGDNITNIAEGGDATATVGDINVEGVGDINIGGNPVNIDIKDLVGDIIVDPSKFYILIFDREKGRIPKLWHELDKIKGDLESFNRGIDQEAQLLDKEIQDYGEFIANLKKLHENLTKYRANLDKKDANPISILKEVNAEFKTRLSPNGFVHKNILGHINRAYDLESKIKDIKEGELELEQSMNKLLDDVAGELRNIKNRVHFHDYSSLKPVGKAVRKRTEELISSIQKLRNFERRKSRKLIGQMHTLAEDINNYPTEMEAIKELSSDITAYVNRKNTAKELQTLKGAITNTIKLIYQKLPVLDGRNDTKGHIHLKQFIEELKQKLPNEYKVSREIFEEIEDLMKDIGKFNDFVGEVYTKATKKA